jgi:hypothetical protein
MEKDDTSEHGSDTPQPRFDDTCLENDLSAVAAKESVGGRTQQGTGVQRHAEAAVSDPKIAT